MVLNGFPILILGHERSFGHMLASAIKEFGGCPIGPAYTVYEGMSLLEKKEIRAAILNGQLPDQDMMSVVPTFMARALPFVVCIDSPVSEGLAGLLPALATVYTPADPIAVLAALLQQVSPDRTLFRRQS